MSASRATESCARGSGIAAPRSRARRGRTCDAVARPLLPKQRRAISSAPSGMQRWRESESVVTNAVIGPSRFIGGCPEDRALESAADCRRSARLRSPSAGRCSLAPGRMCRHRGSGRSDSRARKDACRRRIGRIIPGAGGKLNDAGPNILGQANRRKAGSTRVEQANDVAVGDAARGRIIGMHARDLAPTLLGRQAMSAEIELAVQAGRGLVGHQEEAVRQRRGASSGGSQVGMPGTIGLVEAGDGRRVDLDLAARGRQRCGGRVVAEARGAIPRRRVAAATSGCRSRQNSSKPGAGRFCAASASRVRP